MATELKHTVKPSGGDFTSLDACIDHLVAAHANFVTADVYGLVEISGTWSSADTTAVQVNGLTLDATRYLSIYTDASNRASLSWSTSIYQLLVANNSALMIQDDFVRFDGLQVGKSSSSANGQACIYTSAVASGCAIWISNCLMKQAGNNSYREPGLQSDDGDANIYCWNTASYGSGTVNHASNSPFYLYNGTFWCYSCTAIGGKYGFYCAGAGKTYTLKNCYAGGTITEDFYVTGTGTTLNKTNCASEDQSADDTNAANPAETATNCVAAAVPLSTATFVNVTAGSEDFHLVSGSALIGAGVDTSGEGAPLNFTTDIDGDTRSDWDIGADEYTSSGYSLTCDGGSYALTGTAASPLRAAKVVPEAGSYVLTGTDAALLRGIVIVAAAGSYAVTGADITTPRTYVVAAASGTYTLTGQDIDALYDRIVSAEPGAYTLTGQDAAFLKGLRISAEPGSYAITGIAASLLLARVLGAEAGAYTMTGQDAAVLRNAKIDAEGGKSSEYSIRTNLIGESVALLRHLSRISADVGAYTLTGADVAALLGRVVSAGAGTYTVTGTDATLVYTPGGGVYSITADGGVYAVTGGDAAVLRGLKAAAEAGAYVVTGQAAATLLGRLIDSGAGTYAVTGTDAALLRAAVVSAGAGAYTLTGADIGALLGRIVSAEAGAYTLTGQDAALLLNRLISAGAGAFTLAGQDVTLTYSGAGLYSLVCESGAYTITGTAAELVEFIMHADTANVRPSDRSITPDGSSRTKYVRPAERTVTQNRRRTWN